MASKAGAAKAVAAPMTKAAAHSSQSQRCPSDASTARLPTASARARSDARSTARRERRSETAPPKTRSTTWGRDVATPTPASADGRSAIL